MNRYSVFEGTFNGFRCLLSEPFIRYDAGVNYRWRQFSFDALVTNLTNEPIFLMRGAPPRRVNFTVTSNW